MSKKNRIGNAGAAPPARPTGSAASDASPRPELSSWEGKMVGAYRIENKISSGNYGEVYRATDTNQLLGHRSVALKRLLLEQASSESGRKRFLDEIRSAAKIQGNYITPIYDAGEFDDCLYYTMRYVEGDTLWKYIQRRQPPMKRRLEIFIQICTAVASIHESDMVHRDIHCRNVMIDQRDEVCLLDFGLAKPLDQLLSSSAGKARTAIHGPEQGPLLGTEIFMAPEQVTSPNDVSVKADIYSLGIMLFWLVTDHYPHDDVPDEQRGGDERDHPNIRLMQYIHPHAPAKISARKNGVPQNLDRLASSCMNPDAEIRPSCEEVIRDARLIVLELLQAERRTWKSEGRKWAVFFGIISAVSVASVIETNIVRYQKDTESGQGQLDEANRKYEDLSSNYNKLADESRLLSTNYRTLLLSTSDFSNRWATAASNAIQTSNLLALEQSNNQDLNLRIPALGDRVSQMSSHMSQLESRLAALESETIDRTKAFEGLSSRIDQELKREREARRDFEKTLSATIQAGFLGLSNQLAIPPAPHPIPNQH